MNEIEQMRKLIRDYDQQLTKVLSERLGKLETAIYDVKQQVGNVGESWVHGLRKMDNSISGIGLTHALVRGMFLLEILREKGFLEGINLDEIEAKVAARHAGANAGWGASAEAAGKVIKQVRREIEDDYTRE